MKIKTICDLKSVIDVVVWLCYNLKKSNNEITYNMMALDTHAMVKTLITRGFTELQAEGITDVVIERNYDAATKIDLIELKVDLKEDISELRTELKGGLKGGAL